MAEREIKTVLTLEDASFSKGLKAAANSVSAAKAEMNAAISSAGGLGKGLKQTMAQVKGLSNIVKAQKSQMGVLNKEYNTQKNRLNDLKKAAENARKENGEGSKEAEKAANAYAAQSAKVDDLRVKMANLTVEMNKNKDALKTKLTMPLRAAGNLLKSFGKLAVGALAAGGAALVKFTLDANESKKNFNLALADSRGTFGAWSLFLEEEAKKAWQSLGLSQAAYMQTAAEIGQKLQEGGASVDQSAQWVSQAMELAGKLKDDYGVPIETVLNDIARAAEGDKGALRRYGITIQGINDKMTKSEAASVILKEAMKSAESTAQTLDGNVAQSVDSAGVKLKAAWENFKAGVGSSEDVASAAAEAAAAFGADFAGNLATFIHIAPDTLSAFATEFKNGWTNDVWPEIQDLFHEQFKIDLPDWEQFKTDLKSGFDAAFAGVKSVFSILFGYTSPDPVKVAAQIEENWEEASVSTILQTEPFRVTPPNSEKTKNGIQTWWKSIADSVGLTLSYTLDGWTGESGVHHTGTQGKFAGGLWNVPRNDYMARLHSGEMVLTAAQAARYRAQAAAGGSVNNYNDSSAIYIDKYYQNSETDAQALLNAMSVMQRRQRRGYGMA